MDDRLASNWQAHTRDVQLLQPAYHPIRQVNNPPVPFGPSLVDTVANNEKVPSFAQLGPLNHVQRVLASGRFQEYLCYTDGNTVRAHFEQLHRDIIALLNEQHFTLQKDLPILVESGQEILDFELKITTCNARASSTITLTSQFEPFNKIRALHMEILHMMRVRTALLKQDVMIREGIGKIDHQLSRYTGSTISFVLGIKASLVYGQYNEGMMTAEFWQVMKSLAPWNDIRSQKRAELQAARKQRAELEKNLREAKLRLQELEDVIVAKQEEF